MKLLLQICVLVVACLVASLTAAQRIEGIIPDSVRSYYESECSAELATMERSWDSLGQNGPVLDRFYYNASRLDAAAVREKAREYLEGPGVLSRRWDTDQDWTTNIWENCLVNAREKELGLPITRFTVPPPPPPPPAPPADEGTPFTDEDGNTQYQMADGSNCVRIQTSQARSSRAGYFDQLVSLRNKCARDIPVQVCMPDGTCVTILAKATTTTTETLGTIQGVDPRWTVTPVRQQPQDGGSRQPSPELTNDVPSPGNDTTPIDFGDDNSNWPRDGECDDPRFSGPGAAADPLEQGYFHDATDCLALLAAGQIEFTGYTDGSVDTDSGIDFGDDSGNWPNDGECDDPRFSGSGAADAPREEDIFHDASDCRAALAAGAIAFTGYTDRGSDNNQVQPQDEGDSFGIDDALGIFRDAVDIYTDYQNAVNGGDDGPGYSDFDGIVDRNEGAGDGEYDGEDEEYSDEDDCNFNSDGDPTTVCTVQ